MSSTSSRNDAQEPRIHTALNILTAISYPSVKTVQWSPDGQILFTTKSSVYIFTPDHGINCDNESAAKAPWNEENRENPQTMAWFRTIVHDSKISEGTNWPDRSQEWGTVSLGSIDTSITSVACSPSGISADGRAVLAVLTSNMDLSLWKAGKNYLKGEWSKINDITPFLLSHHTDGSKDPSVANVLEAQTTCISWTPRANFQLLPTPSMDSSLLVLGNRAGCLTFLRYSPDDPSVNLLISHNVSDHWVTRIAPSSWRLTSPGVCELDIAFSASSGDVNLITVVQRLSTDKTSFFIPRYALDLDAGSASESIVDFDNTVVTALQWVEIPQRPPILAICKPGIVYLWSKPSPDGLTWSGLVSFELETQKISNASSAFHPASGIVYLQHYDCLVISLYDGSIHTIHSLSREPTLVNVDSSNNPICSENLSRIARLVFMRVEEEKVDKKTMNRISGLVGYDGYSTFLWTHDAAIPSDFSYKHDAKHSSMMVVSQLWDTSDVVTVLSGLDGALNGFDPASPVIPLHLLRPTFSRLQYRALFEAAREEVLNLIRTPIPDHSTQINVARLSVPLDGNIRLEYRRSLQTHLFGWPEIVSLRMRLSVADFVWKYSSTGEKQAQCGQIAQGILNSISHRNLRALIRHMVAVVDSLSSTDIPFILRLILQSALEGSPLDLKDEGLALTSLTDHLVPKDPSTGSIADELNELCPACQAPVPLQDITNAVCPNGHHWKRCSITTFILSTPWVRTCVGCSRKAFLAPGMLTAPIRLPEVAQGWVVRELLEAVNQCLYCNNNFVSLV